MNSKANLGLAALIVAGFAGAGYYLVTTDNVQATLQTGVESFIGFVDRTPPGAEPEPEAEPEAETGSIEDPASDPTPAPVRTARPNTPAPATDGAPSSPAVPEPVAAAPPEMDEEPPAVVPARPEAATEAATEALAETAPPQPEAHFLPGNQSTWIAFDVPTARPVTIRAAGLVATRTDVASPDGLTQSTYEQSLKRSKSGRHARVLSSAPYLALIGRICSDRRCSEPFLVGSDTVVCPGDPDLTGRLQLLTNNYVRIDGQQTLRAYSGVSGGYSVLTEAATPGTCRETPGDTNPNGDSSHLEPGLVLKRPEFRVTSSQTYWKPFFVPLDEPVVIRASGEITSGPKAPRTGPDGAPMPETPAQNGLGLHGLYEPSFPYHALIGRLCSEDACGRPFLVGRQQTVCPTDRYDHHIELWINRIMTPPGMLDSETPLTFRMFDLQARSGEYQFEFTSAPSGLCNGS